MLGCLILHVQNTENCLNNINNVLSSNGIMLTVVSILIVVFSLALTFLLSFWWQSGQARYEHIKYLIHEYRDKQNKSTQYLKSIEEEAEIQFNIIVYKIKSDGKLKTFYRSLFLILYIILITIILISIIPFVFKHTPALNLSSFFKIDFYDYVSTIITILTSILGLLFLNKLGTITFDKGSAVNLIANFYYSQLKNEFNLPKEKAAIGEPEKLYSNNGFFRFFTNKIKNIMKFTSKQSMFLGVISLIAFILAWTLGVLINTITGIPLTGGILNGVIVGAMITIGIKGVDKFGSATIIWIVFATLAIPTTTFGFPGWYKPIIGILSGVIWDLFAFVIFKRMNNFFKYIIPAGIGAAAITFGVFIAMGLFNIPGYDKLKSALTFLIPLYFIISCLGGWLGIFLYDKYLSSIPFIKSLNHGNDSSL